MGMNASDGGDPALQRIVRRALKADRAGFGHAVGDGDVAHVHLLVDAPHHLDRAGRAGHDAGSQRRQVEFGKLGMVEFGDEHGRYAVERRALLTLDGLQCRQRIESFAGIDHGCAQRDRSKIAHHHAEAVIERNRNADAVVFGQAHRAADEITVVEDVMMRQRDALGRSGGAAGKLNIDRIVELQCLGERRQRIPVPCAAQRRHLFERNRAGKSRAADLDHGAQLRQPRRVQIARLRFRQFRHQRVEHFHVVAGLECRRRNDRGASDLGKCEFKLAQAVCGIDGDENEPRLGGGKLRQRPFRPVERPDAEPRAAFEAK